VDFGGGRGWVGSTAYVRKCVVRGLNACRKKDGRDRYINRVRSPWARPPYYREFPFLRKITYY